MNIFKNLNPLVLILFFSLTFIGCSDLTQDEATEDIVYSANNLLNQGNCEDAIELLEEYGRKDYNASYMMTLSSAYACRAGFTEPKIYTELISSAFSTAVSGGSDSQNAQGMINFFVKMDTSLMTIPAYDDYVSLLEAINIIQFAGGVTAPGHASRSDVFGTDSANDMNMKLLYMFIQQIGNYSYFYGNASRSTGTKGDTNSNGYSNSCYMDYNSTGATTVRGAGAAGACAGDADAHPLMDLNGGSVTDAEYVTRACQGVVLMNGFIDALGNITFSSSMSSINTASSGTTSTFTSLCETALAAQGYPTTICSERSQANCEATYGTDTSGTVGATYGTNVLEIYFASVWETLHQ